MFKSSLCLNGERDFMPVYGRKAYLEIPEELIFEKEKIRVPSSWRYVALEGTPYYNSGFGIVDDFQPFNMFEYPMEWSRADTGVYRRMFVIPDNMLAGRVYLRFDGIIQMSAVYVNGNKAAVWDEAYLPLRIDVTEMIWKDGRENELIVVCTTFDEIVTEWGQTKSLGLIGSWYGNMGRGIWQDVFLESFPETYLDDLFIDTSFRKKELAVTGVIKNPLPGMSVNITVMDETSIAFEFGQKLPNEENEKCIPFRLIQYWNNPRLWSFEDPHLYDLQIELVKDGRVIDTIIIKFGFREVWAEDYKFMLNGIRINLRGDSWHFQGAIQQSKEYALNWFSMCKEMGLNFIRLHAEPYPECYLDAADEIGIMIVDETAIYGSAKSMPAHHPVYLSRCKKHVERLVKRDRNHPSVIMWSLQNEMRWVDGRDAYKQHIPEMMDIIKKLDGTRLIILEGDNRLLPKELTEVDTYHYNIDGTIAQWKRKHPLIYGEHGGWWYLCPQNSSAFAGLKSYMDPDYCSEGMALKERLYVEYARRNDVTGITSFNFAHYMMKSMPDEDIRLNWDRLDTPGCKPRILRKHSLTINNGYLKDYPIYIGNPAIDILRDSYRPVVIIPSEYDTAFYDYPGIARGFDVYNDTLYRHSCRVELIARRDDNEAFFRKSFDFPQEPGERRNIKICFDPPKVQNPSELILEAELYHEDRLMYKLSKSYKL